MIKAYKYKLKPNSTQEIAINQFLGSARFIYNWGLNRKSEQYKLNLAKSIQSVSWSTFVNMLNYKSEHKGKNIIFIGRYEPSSKLCHTCGYINKDLTLKDREWVCPICGEHHDRDVNAAINIRHIAFEKQNLIGC